MITIISSEEMPQGSEKWAEFRKTRISGTDAYSLLKGTPISEILHKKATNNFHGNYYTQRGHILEAEARDIYSQVNSPANEAGAIINSKYPNAMMSPDGTVGQDGLIEIKCFQPKRHFKVYRELDPTIIAQIQFGLFISEREWCDLVLYNPDLEDPRDCFLTKRIRPIKSTQSLFKKLLSKEAYHST